MRTQVAAQRLRQHADGALGAAVGGLARGAHVRGDRAHAADRAAVPLPDHLLGALRADHPGAADVRLEQGVEVLEGRLVPLHERVDCRVRHHAVQPASSLGRGAHHRDDLLRITHVGDHREAFPAGFGDPAERLGRIAGRQLDACVVATGPVEVGLRQHGPCTQRDERRQRDGGCEAGSEHSGWLSTRARLA